MYSKASRKEKKMTSSLILLPLLQRLASHRRDRANYLLQAWPVVYSLHVEVGLLNDYMKDVDKIHHKIQGVEVWGRKLSELSFEAENAIDLFVYEVALRQQENVVMKIIKLPQYLYTTRKLIVKIQDIGGRIKEIADYILKQEIQPLEVDQTCADQVHQRVPFVDVVGFQSDEEKLVKLLMKERIPFGVVSITGMGGLGKTTLAKKIYDRVDVKRHFDCQSWVCLSKKYKIEDVLLKIITQVEVLTVEERRMLAFMGVKSLEARLSKCLKDKNYFFVIDDVWEKEDWNELRASFPNPRNNQRCIVLLTSRDNRVGCFNSIAPPHQLKCLDKQRSLELFFNVVFRVQVDSNYTKATLNHEMKSLAEKIVSKCDGLPLAILVLGGLLSDTTPTIDEWKSVFDNVDWYLDEGNCYKVLALSFNELTDELKSCFLYFGLFPEDTIIHRDRLIRLLAAEGFLQSKPKLRREDVAACCLQELMYRNLIQVAKWKTNGVPESFIIHKLLLNLAISKAKEVKFLDILNPQVSLVCSRRVALHGGNYIEDTMGSNNLRLFISFTEISQLPFSGQFKLLNVLDVECAPGIETLPGEMGKLIFLKYLNLSRTGLKNLPPWIGNLYNLQTLNLYKTMVVSVPTEILKLINLRYLLCCNRKIRYNLYAGEDISWMPDDFIAKSDRRIDQLRDLQTLWFHTGIWMEDGLEMLTNLRELGLTGIKGLMRNFEEVLSQALVKLKLLEVLYLEEQDECEIILPSFSGHRYLDDITIIGVIGKLPQLSEFPPNLTKLRLSCHHLKEDMMETLEKLPELKKLRLDWHPYDGIIMKCSAGGFPKLEYLTLIYFDWLCYWVVEEGAMPNLKILDINRVYGLKWIPSGLRHITTLEKLFMTMPKEFLQRVKEGGKDWEKIKHIPSINTREEETPQVISRRLPTKISQWFQSNGQEIPEDH